MDGKTLKPAAFLDLSHALIVGRRHGSLRAPFAALLLVTLQLACSRSESEQLAAGDIQAEQIEVWAWNIAALSLKDLEPTFRQLRPDVAVSINMTGANMESRFLLSLAAGVGAPDVSQLQVYDAPRFTPSGRLLDLTDRAGKYADQFPRSCWNNCVHDGRVYAIPWDIGPCAVFYKRALFNRFGVDPDSIETWDDYIAAGRRILEASGGRTRMLPLSVNGLWEQFEVILQQTGGGIFDQRGRIILHSPENRMALQCVRAILDAGIAAPVNMYSHEYFASFKNDSVATYPMAAWASGMIKDNAPETAGDWGVFPMPAAYPGGVRVCNLGGSVLVIPAQTSHPEAAWAFIEYALCTRAGQIAQFKSRGLFPALLPALDDPFIDEPDPFFGNQPVRRLFATDLDKIPALTRTRDWAEARRYISQGLSRWATQNEDHDAFLARMTDKLRRKLGREVVLAGETQTLR